MSLQIRNSGPLVSSDDLEKVELSIGHKLPVEYKSFLCRQNGGHPEPGGFKTDSNVLTESCVHYFYGIGDNATHVEFLKAFKIFKERIPEQLVPIGDDPVGNQICIAVEGSEIGAVYLWDHEQEHYPPSFRNIHKLSPSFQIFIDNFFELVDDQESAMLLAIKKDDVYQLTQLLGEGDDVEQQDEYGRTLIENAAIANAVNVIGYLFSRGAHLRNALSLAEENAKFFPGHLRSVTVLRRLQMPN